MPIDLNSVRNSNASAVQAQGDAGFRAYIHSVYSYMSIGLALTGLVAYFAYSSGFYMSIARTPLVWVVMLAPLAMVMFLSFRIQKMSLATAQVTYWIYAALMGLSLSYIFLAYSGQSIARVFFISAGTFGGMSLYGYTTKSDLTRWGSFLMMGLFGVIIASVVNLFMHSTALQLTVSVMGVIVFVGLTAYDTQNIKRMYYAAGSQDDVGKFAVMGALRLYLDFINLFLMLLRLFGGRRG
jgi:FtsH-binding integral membrane protein